MILAIDFDGTCVKHKFPDIGEDIGAAPILKQITDNGHQLLLFTMRNDNPGKRPVLTEALDWFKERDIPIWAVNENPDQKSWTLSPKPYAHCYLDDAAIGIPLKMDRGDSRPYVDWGSVLLHLVNRGFISAHQYVDLSQKNQDRPIYFIN
jgi:hypothetical protein